MIITLNEDGSFKDGIMQYRIREDGKLDERKFYTTSIKSGLDTEKMNTHLLTAKIHVKKGAGISDVQEA